MLAPKHTLATYVFGYVMAILNKSFLGVVFPKLLNSATAPNLVDLLDCPPVLEYTYVSRTKIFIFSPEDKIWSIPEKPIS